MVVTMQGTWLGQAKSKSSTTDQRFVISGADYGNGIYSSSGSIFVTGNNWFISVQHKPTGGPFIPSDMRIKYPKVAGSWYSFDIDANDTDTDQDFNDLILKCSSPVTDNDFVIYGNVNYYSEHCIFNPCFRLYVVIDNYLSYKEAIRIPEIYKEIERLYPERLPKKRLTLIPEEYKGVFKPIILPLQDASIIPEKSSIKIKVRPAEFKLNSIENKSDKYKMLNYNEVVTSEVIHVSAEKAKATYDPEKLNLGKYIDKFHTLCETGPLPNALLRFQEYDRTTVELTGGPYSGEGTRELLGNCVTDMNGNYLFCFSRSQTQFIIETTDTPDGGDVLTHSMPDIIVQLIDQSTNMILYESTPFWNIPYLRGINICIPKKQSGLIPFACENHNNIIQSVGDIELGPLQENGTRTGFNNYLSDNGIVTAYNAIAPQVRCTAWNGRLDIYGCMKHKDIKYYTVRYRKLGSAKWLPILDTLVQYKYVLNGTNITASVNVEVIAGLKIDGSATAEDTKAFLNVQNDAEAWTELSRITKARMYTSRYENGSTQFRFEGFKSNGSKISNADEIITLYIDNEVFIRDVALDIHDTITMNGEGLSNCALFTLPVLQESPLVLQENAPIAVRIKANQISGFMDNYQLYLQKGATGTIGILPAIENAVFPTIGQFMNVIDNRGRKYVHGSNTICDLRFKGTDNESGVPSDGYFDVVLTPSSGQWLNSDENFCSFGLYLCATMRHTDGKEGYPYPTYSTPVLIGIQRPV